MGEPHLPARPGEGEAPSGPPVNASLADVLAIRWRSLFSDQARDAVFFDLARAYAAPGRHYHNLAHVSDCLARVDEVRAHLVNGRAIKLALFFHDAVYDPTRADNEERSADLARQNLRDLGETDALIATVRQLILDTRHREPPATPDGRYLVDIDLSILGQPPDVYDFYDRNIRREYAHVPEDAYRVGRAKVLNAFLNRPHIFATETFRARYERQARENLARSIARLMA